LFKPSAERHFISRARARENAFSLIARTFLLITKLLITAVKEKNKLSQFHSRLNYFLIDMFLLIVHVWFCLFKRI